MKFIELKKFLKQSVLLNSVLWGNDAFLLQKSVDLIRESQSFEPAELNEITFKEQIDGKTVVQALNTFPVMSEFKLVVVDLTKNASVANLDEIKSYLKSPNPSSILILIAGSDKALAEQFGCEMVDCNKLSDAMVQTFVISELNKFGKTITTEALKTLCAFGVYNLTYITAELSKLIAYVGNKKEIVLSDVQEIATKNLEYQVFDLTESLAKQNAEKAYQILNEMLSKRENEKMILPLVYNHFRRLLFASLSVGDGVADMAKMLKVKEYAITKAKEQSKWFSQKKLKAINDLCLQLDFSVKNGDMLSENAISLLVLQILNLR